MNRLLGHIAALVLTGVILTGCAFDDEVRELRSSSNHDESLAITFANGVIDKPIVTRATTLLSDHMNTMGVWGWQTTPLGAVERIFLNQKVTFNAPEAKWTYSPLKYWENNSTYKFVAYAPHASSVPGVTASIDSVTRAISIKGVTLSGSNTITAGMPVSPAKFDSVPDTDWMIDRFGQSMVGMNRSQVTFSMQHILSKICVRVTRSATFLPDSVMPMTLDSIKITSLVSQGDFAQSIHNDSIGILSEWTPVDTLPRYTITSAKEVGIPDSALYVIESLMIPQPVDDSQYIHLWYRIGADNRYNKFYYVMKLSDVFGRFIAGRNYLLTIVIGPEAITFDAGVSGWDDYNEDANAFSRYIQ